MKNYMKFSRFELCKALDHNEFDNLGEAAIQDPAEYGDNELFILPNHWTIYRYYAEVHGIYPIAESKYWLAYDAEAVFSIDDILFEMMREDDCVPYVGCDDTSEKMLYNFNHSDAVDLIELNYLRK